MGKDINSGICCKAAACTMETLQVTRGVVAAVLLRLEQMHSAAAFAGRKHMLSNVLAVGRLSDSLICCMKHGHLPGGNLQTTLEVNHLPR